MFADCLFLYPPLLKELKIKFSPYLFSQKAILKKIIKKIFRLTFAHMRSLPNTLSNLIFCEANLGE